MPKITKTEAAALLDKTPRAVERYAASGRLSVTYEKGKTRDIPQYDRAEVEALARELQKPSTPARGTVATPGDNGDAGVSQVVAIRSQALERQTGAKGMAIFVSAIKDALQGNHAPKMLLSLTDAAEVSGLSASHLLDAIHDGRLDGRKIGRGFKIRPADLQEYAKQVWKDAPEYEKPEAKKLGNGLKVKASKA
jgi:excisionase family DNA binding protein